MGEVITSGRVGRHSELYIFVAVKYLGLTLGVSFKSKTIWDGVVEKMERLARWKIYLSRGGRLILMKNTLSRLQMYFLSLFSLLAGLARRLDCLQRDFLWEWIGGEPKFHLFAPEFLEKLGVINLMLFKKALLSKWLWRFMREENFYGDRWLLRSMGSKSCMRMAGGIYLTWNVFLHCLVLIGLCHEKWVIKLGSWRG